ncbi:hypothetical protein BJY00DRAFT_132266 [Aspergillus carlsbadensis]|nr:hypothetical protein BJY00DRAFT_132266 [Aspergillus carlsbadensis]
MEIIPALELFTIGWICALPLEAAVAREMLDENFGILQRQDRADPNIYTLGKVGDHHIVIACIGGQYGTTSATIVASNMKRTFSGSLRIGLMIGIGGGIPRGANDIRLGDIVVSYPTGTSSGVVQHDMGKISQAGRFTRTGFLNTPPRLLLAAVNLLRDGIHQANPLFLSSIDQLIQKNFQTRQKFSRPDDQHDRLFQPRYEHPLSASTCDTCPSEWEVTRPRRDDNGPRVHYGIIASGNSVIKHAETREQIADETGAICVDMEAAGLMMDFPCLIIRGICDYADSHKNKKWQDYAALAAASYAKELLRYLPVGEVSHERPAAAKAFSVAGHPHEILDRALKRTFDQQDNHHLARNKRIFSPDHQRCHQALKSSPYEQYKNLNPVRAEMTCQWVLRNPQFAQWSQSENDRLLWISADPGCGKSVLARSLVDNDLMQYHPSASICYFFFKNNSEQNSLATALCAILHQLFTLQPKLITHAIPSWERNGFKLQTEIDEMWRILLSSAADPTFMNTICIFDALDEIQSTGQKVLIQKLQSLYCQAQPPADRRGWLKFLVTSRPYDEIEDMFEPLRDISPSIHLSGETSIDQIRYEVQLVVQIKVSELARTLNLELEIKNSLEKWLLKMEHRTYLWLFFAINDITDAFKNSLRPNMELIKAIPNSVQEAYIRILNRVTDDQLPIAKKILQITAGAKRPLTIQEMAIALGIATTTPDHRHSESGISLDSQILGDKIRRLCGLFVFIQNSKVYLIHQTAHEFLIKSKFTTCPSERWYLDLVNVDAMMTSICARYLLLDGVENGKKNFLAYAAEYWSHHYRMTASASDAELERLVQKLYHPMTSQIFIWFPLYWEFEMPSESMPEMAEIHLAAFSGHDRMVRMLLDYDQTCIERQDSKGTTPLQWAALRGHHGVVCLLLERGADANTRGGRYGYGNAVHAAAEGGQLLILQVLLENGADVHASARSSNALYAAAESGYHEVVQMLLDNGADVDTNFDETFGSALAVASYSGHCETVQALLQGMADVNAEGGAWGSALQAASLQGHTEIVEILLNRGGDVNAKGGGHGSALQGASHEGHLEVVEILLSRGADIDAKTGFLDLCTALQAAASEGHFDIAQLLVLRGAGINLQGDKGTALQCASRSGYMNIVSFLIDSGAEVNIDSEKCGTALQDACIYGHYDIVQMLLANGANVSWHGGYYGTALEAALSQGHTRIVQLLENGGQHEI